MAMLIARAAEAKSAADIKVLDLKRISPLADYLVICTGESAPQIRAISLSIDEKLRAKGIKSKASKWEGKLNSNWMVLDLGSVVVHVMGPEERARYKLEDLWEKRSIVYHL